MTIALRAAGTATSTTAAVTAVNPAVPAGATTGDLSVLSVYCKPYSTTLTTPSGWTKIAEATNGTTAAGDDTGSTLVALYVKVSATVGAIGNIGQSGADTMGAVINTYSGASGTWDTSVYTSGGDATDGADYAATGAAGIDVAAGDLVVSATAVNGDVGTISGTTLAGMAGATLGTQAVRQSANVSTGTDCLGLIADRAVSSGTSNAAPTFTYNNASTGSGTSMWLRVREGTSATIAAVPISVTWAALNATFSSEVVIEGGGPIGMVWAVLPAVFTGISTAPTITAALVGPATQPRPVMVNITGLAIGEDYVVTASSGTWSRIVQGGEGIATATQLVLTDISTPLNAALTYTVVHNGRTVSTALGAALSTRTNAVANPRLGAASTGWSAAVGGTRVVQGDGFAFQMNVAASSNMFSPVAPGASVGQYWSGSVVLLGPVGRTVNVVIWDGSGYVTPSISVVLTGAVQTVAVTCNAALSNTGPSIAIYPTSAGGAWTSGQLLTATDALLEMVSGVGVAAGSYFDGATADAAFETYAWSGTADASTSTDTVWAPIVVAYAAGECLIQSLDGRTVAGFSWMDNNDPREQDIRSAFYRPSGRPRAIMHYDISGADSGTIVARTDDADTTALLAMIAAGAPVLLRTDVGIRDLDPVDVLGISKAPRQLAGGVGTTREWNIDYTLVDDQDAEPLVMATFADFDDYYAGATFADFDVQWAGQTFADFDAFDWLGSL